MKPLLPDTHPEAEKVLIALLRKTPAWQKCQQVSSMIHACRQLSLVGLRIRYPDASEKELRRRLAALWLPRELVIKVYGWDPEKEGY
ncbi:MAG: hypothetical protein V1899_05565 [Planctomycetota bacterium]